MRSSRQQSAAFHRRYSSNGGSAARSIQPCGGTRPTYIGGVSRRSMAPGSRGLASTYVGRVPRRATIHRAVDPALAFRLEQAHTWRNGGNMFHQIMHSADDLISSDGAWWILGLNGILLIPAIFAVFFYPVEVLTTVAGLVVLMVVGLFARRMVIRRRVLRKPV